MLAEDSPPISDSIELEENYEILYAIASLSNRFVDDVTKRYVEPIVADIEKIRDVLDIRFIGRDENKRDEFVSILSVDSTWTKPFIELVIGDIAVIATGYVIVTPAGMGSYGIEYIGFRRGSLDDEHKFGSDVELDAKIMEFYTALKKIDSYIDLVMLDGSLYFSTIPEFFSPLNVVDIIETKKRLWGPKLASLASAVLIKMFRKAQRLGIPVVGVVKRVASRFLLPIISGSGPRDVEEILIRTNDKFLLSLILRPGEYIVIDSYLDGLAQYLSYIVKKFSGHKVRRAQKVLKILEESCNSVENLLLNELCSYMKDTAIVFYKQVGDAVYPQAVRLDIYPRTAVEKVVKYAIYNTSQNSVPIPIDYIDRYIRLESTLMKKVYGIIKTYVKSFESLIALSPTNPQKYYLFERLEEISG